LLALFTDRVLLSASQRSCSTLPSLKAVLAAHHRVFLSSPMLSLRLCAF
jgi:hypothetical protein